MYAHIFDKAVFYISIDETTQKYVREIKDFILSIKEWEDIRIRVIQNDIFCESRTFKEEVLDKKDHYCEEIIFFGHTKGVTNVITHSENIEGILKWIYGCYFYSLEYVEEVVRELIYGYRTFYGSILMETEEMNRVNTEQTTAIYAGAFYWLNPMKLDRSISIVKDTEKMVNRRLSEEYPSFFLFNNGDGYLYSHDNKYLYSADLYCGNFDGVGNFLGDYAKFTLNYNEIMSKIIC